MPTRDTNLLSPAPTQLPGHAITMDASTSRPDTTTMAPMIIPVVTASPTRSLTTLIGIGLVASLAALSAPTAMAGEAAKDQPHEPIIDGPTFVPENLFTVADGLEVTLWATSPLLYNPTNIDVDIDGRVWVAEGVNYRSLSGRRIGGDRIVVLEDTTGAGKADKTTTFVQEKDLVAPLGIAVLDNQVVVSQPPDLLLFTDVNHNHIYDEGVDKREVLLTGFNGWNHDHSLHKLTSGPDGLWYLNQGNTGAQFTDKSGKTFYIGSHYDMSKSAVNPATIAGKTSDDGHVYVGGFTARMNPDGTNVAVIGFNYRNSYEQTVTSFGDVFQSDNDDPPACRVAAVMEFGNAGFNSPDGKRSWGVDKRPGQSTQIAEWRQEDPGTMPAGDVYGGGSPTGVAFYETGALGDKWRGLLLACEAGRNVVFGYMPKVDGAGFKLERFDFLTTNTEKVFAGSDFTGGKPNEDLKTKFRPSDVVVGPDGAIYVADWFDARVGGHQTLDKSWSGAIYRIAPKGAKLHVPKIDLTTTEGQIQALRSPAVNVRYSGFIRLKAQGDKAIPALADMLKDENPYIAARAIWLLAQMGPNGAAQVTPLLESKSDATRMVAYRALRRANHDVLAMAARMAKDPSPEVRREVALTMRDVPLAQSRDILVTIAKQYDGVDRAYLEAFGTGCQGKEHEVYSAVSTALGGPAAGWSDAFARITWRLSPPDAVADLKARALSSALPGAARKLAMDSLAFIKSAEAAKAMVAIAQTKDFPYVAQATWWLFNRKDNDWKEFDLAAQMKSSGLYDPDTVTLVAAVSPEPPPGPSKLPPIAEIKQMAGDVERGRAAVTICYTCHHIGNQGGELGPDLTSFGRTQPAEVILDSIINPSADIALGYDASHLEAKDGTIIDGIVIQSGDPVIIKSMGGLVQTVPRSKIKALTKMKRSLMFSAEMMGITPQGLADIVAYLKSDKIK
jgi:putative membrane-bound dehydrogenase-like protein